MLGDTVTLAWSPLIDRRRQANDSQGFSQRVLARSIPLMPLLEVQNLSKTYGSGLTAVPAVRGVSFLVQPGEFVAIMGPSGCGKSSLLHILAGIEPPTSGKVLLEGKDFGAMSDDDRTLMRRRRLGFVSQKMNLLATLSAEENVAIPLMLDGVRRKDALQRAGVCLAEVGMAHRKGHFPDELSGGEQQRVAIARALVIEPAVLFADEPTGALDSANGQRVFDLLRKIVAEKHQTVIMVTHDAHLAAQAERTIQMMDGEMQSDSGRPKHPIVGVVA